LNVPETPKDSKDLALLMRLKQYALGAASWNGSGIGPEAREACDRLYTDTLRLVRDGFAPLLDCINTAGFLTFTMHDHRHSLKVAHLMWHILSPERRERLSPPEIAMLVDAAFLHDLGMLISQADREALLSDTSDLWGFLGIDPELKRRLDTLREQCSSTTPLEEQSNTAYSRLHQAEEFLLAHYVRRLHAERERYEAVIEQLRDAHRSDAAKAPDVDQCISFMGDSFLAPVIEICVSHNESAGSLIRPDPKAPNKARFPEDSFFGTCRCDQHLVAAALRMGDILDFDRERTPFILHHYLLPTHISLNDERGILEWQKHMHISYWDIGADAIVYRGHCHSHLIHHAIVTFAQVIEDEITETLATFETADAFALPSRVKTQIEAHGYTYVPYTFTLDEERVYSLLMGHQIYKEPLASLRELIQNAVDACCLRDSLTRAHDLPVEPASIGRITITYQPSRDETSPPKLIVEDKGTGMDARILREYFLGVGRSYYTSPEFSRLRAELDRHGVDFSPVSEFGIGFLSVFVIADQVIVETAMWEAPPGDDTCKRTLTIDGPTRLIRWVEEENAGVDRFSGTRITLLLRSSQSRGNASPPKWEEVQAFVKGTCEALPYTIELRLETADEMSVLEVNPAPEPKAPDGYLSYTIPLENEQFGFKGSAVVFDDRAERKKRRDRMRQGFMEKERSVRRSSLLRGGFRIGEVRSLPSRSIAQLHLTWETSATKRYPTTDLPRTSLVDDKFLEAAVEECWIRHSLEHRMDIPREILEILGGSFVRSGADRPWLRQHTAQDLYETVRPAWVSNEWRDEERLRAWEAGKGSGIWVWSIESPKIASYSHPLYVELLHLVLPMISAITVQQSDLWYELGDYADDSDHSSEEFVSLRVAPPMPTWRQVLRETNAGTLPQIDRWVFGMYDEDYEDALFAMAFAQVGPTTVPIFNVRFREQLSKYSVRQLITAGHALHALCEMRADAYYAPVLSEPVLTLLRRIVDSTGESTRVVYRRTWWELSSFGVLK